MKHITYTEYNHYIRHKSVSFISKEDIVEGTCRIYSIYMIVDGVEIELIFNSDLETRNSVYDNLAECME